MGKIITPMHALDDQLRLNGKKGIFEESLNDEDAFDEDYDYTSDMFLGGKNTDVGMYNLFMTQNAHEIEEHIGDISAMESKVVDLLYLTEDISNAKGMNQAFAMEAEKCIPNFGNVPIGFYSKELTATRYKLSLETLIDNIWTTIKNIAKKIIEMIKKFSDWLFNKKDTTKESLKNTVENHKKAAKTINEYAAAYAKEFGGDINKILIDYAATSIAKDTPVEQLINSTNPYFHDIVSRGKYFSLMENANTQLMTIEFGLRTSLKNISLVTNAVEHTSKQFGPKDLINFDKLKAEIRISLLGHNDISIAEAVDVINKVNKEIGNSTPTTSHIHFTELNTLFAKSVDGSNMITRLDDLDEFEAIFNKCIEILDSFDSALDKAIKVQYITPELRETVNAASKVLSEIRIEVLSSFKYLLCIKSYANIISNMSTYLLASQKAALLFIEEGIKAENKVVSTELKELHSQLLEILKDEKN